MEQANPHRMNSMADNQNALKRVGKLFYLKNTFLRNLCLSYAA